jgi:hypothetical protein
MSTKKGTKYRSLAAGITKRLSGATSVTLDNTTYVPADLAKLLASIADALDAAPPLKAAWESSARSAASAEAKAHPVMVAFVKWVRATYGKEPAILQDFGLAAPVPHPATAATKAKAQAEAKATRQQKKQGTTAAAPAATVAPAGSTSAKS